MLGLSSLTRNAIVALGSMHALGGGYVPGPRIAESTGIPQPYLSKIMLRLARAGLVQSKRGFRGGFRLARPAGQISVLDVADALEGPAWLGSCLLGLDEKDCALICPAHGFCIEEGRRIREHMSRLTLDRVALPLLSRAAPPARGDHAGT